MKKLLPFSIIGTICIAIAAVNAYGDINGADHRPLSFEDDSEVVEVVIDSNVIASAFQEIPDRDLDLLTKQMRWEMAVYMEADSIYKQRNIFSGLSWIEKMTDDYMSVHLTNVSNLTLKRLDAPKLKSGYVVMSIYTITGENDTADSTIKFYTPESPDTTSLLTLPTKRFFRIPSPSDFFIEDKNGRMSRKALEALLPFHTVAYEISPSGDTLIGRPTIANYLTQELRAQIEPYLAKELKWEWDGKGFVALTR